LLRIPPSTYTAKTKHSGDAFYHLVKFGIWGAPRQGLDIEHFTMLYMYCKEGELMLAIRLPEEIEERLNVLAKKTGRTKTFYVREAILEYLDDIEDIYLAEKRLADIRAGRSKPIPLKNVMNRYDLED
jgi:RHH-type rel operon transcriptional repressor/antitoxin RelB